MPARTARRAACSRCRAARSVASDGSASTPWRRAGPQRRRAPARRRAGPGRAARRCLLTRPRHGGRDRVAQLASPGVRVGGAGRFPRPLPSPGCGAGGLIAADNGPNHRGLRPLPAEPPPAAEPVPAPPRPDRPGPRPARPRGTPTHRRRRPPPGLPRPTAPARLRGARRSRRSASAAVSPRSTSRVRPLQLGGRFPVGGPCEVDPSLLNSGLGRHPGGRIAGRVGGGQIAEPLDLAEGRDRPESLGLSVLSVPREATAAEHDECDERPGQGQGEPFDRPAPRRRGPTELSGRASSIRPPCSWAFLIGQPDRPA